MIVPVTLFEQNCTIIWYEPTKKAVVIDPGGDVPKIQEAIKQTGVTVEKIWLTHGHIDHVGGAGRSARRAAGADRGSAYRRQVSARQCGTSGERFGMTGVRNFAPDRWLDEGDQVAIGELTFDILHCPGHSPGSVVFFSNELRFAHVGDVLFNGSVGRTDLPGGSHATLINSITEKLLPLGDDVGFICGHGAGSSIGQERMTNPFITGEMEFNSLEQMRFGIDSSHLWYEHDLSENRFPLCGSCSRRRGYFINPAAVSARVMTSPTSMPRRGVGARRWPGRAPARGTFDQSVARRDRSVCGDLGSRGNDPALGCRSWRLFGR